MWCVPVRPVSKPSKKLATKIGGRGGSRKKEKRGRGHTRQPGDAPRHRRRRRRGQRLGASKDNTKQRKGGRESVRRLELVGRATAPFSSSPGSYDPFCCCFLFVLCVCGKKREEKRGGSATGPSTCSTTTTTSGRCPARARHLRLRHGRRNWFVFEHVRAFVGRGRSGRRRV